jgi:tRNA (cmo5U34)-methyltransferase
MDGREWHEEARAARYLSQTPGIPWWDESERAVREHLPARVDRFLDVGTGDGRLIALVRGARPGAAAVGLDFSPPMLAAARTRFSGEDGVELVRHDLTAPLPALGTFDLVVSAFAIHHLDDARKRALYRELHDLLRPGGRLLNLEHVPSASPALHAEFLAAIGDTPDDEDPSDRPVAPWIQADWLAEIGFADADCHWKWRELALIGGRRP